MKPDIPSQKEVDKEIHAHMTRAWNRYRKNALQWLPEEGEHMRADIEEVLGQAFYHGGVAAGGALRAVFEKHLNEALRKRTAELTESPEPKQ